MVIVNHGDASKVVEFSRQHGSHGATILPGSGTRRNSWLEKLGLNEVRRELVFMVVESTHTAPLLDALRVEFEMDKPGKGIAIAMPIDWAFGIHQAPTEERINKDPFNHHCHLICTIVDRSYGEDVVALGDEAGVNGATLVHGYGTAERGEKVFDFPIEPEKDLVFMIVEDNFEEVFAYMKNVMHLDKPNSGIQFVMPVTYSVGLYREDGDTPRNEHAGHCAEETEKVALHLITAPNVLDHALQVADQVGVGGATHLPARGATSRESLKIFNLPLEPRKEWITIITDRAKAEKLTFEWREQLAIDAPGQGILFAIRVLKDVGLYEG